MDRVIVIGASLSGIDTLSHLVSLLPADLPAPVLITQHVASHSPGLLPHILSEAGPLPAAHAKSPQLLERGRIYVAPPDRHMMVRDHYVRLSHGPQENLARPAIDPLFRSAAIAYGPAVIGVVLTGQLDDGTAGLLAIKDRGGTTIVQDPAEATAPSMPQSALAHVPVDHTCKIAELALLLVGLANDDPSAEPPDGFDRLMEIENRIADGVFSVGDWWGLEQMSAPSGLNCPTCRSALYELNDTRVLRFRCRSGHAFSALSLLSGQAGEREAQMSSLFGSLIEEATLAKRVAATTDAAMQIEDLSARAAFLERDAGQVSDWLRAMSGLVDPEPAGR
jgi:two-component system chemotaxis response regulator CheB